jgi:phage/plasmid-like protein (TIGR03299 family)
MSRETTEWLNTRILVGYTESRGNAWHYRLENQGDESNHYAGAIPVDDVLRRLFDFTVNPEPVYTFAGTEGYREIPNKRAMVCSDNGDTLGIFADTYAPHQYAEWLVSNVASILSGDLGIGGAGLLRNRAQAYVQVEMPESITTPEGITFRPHLLATTSFDGSLSTTYKPTNTIVVCDNTREAALGEESPTFKIKHSKYSALRIMDAREALGIVHTMADDFAAEVAELCATQVTPQTWERFLALYAPSPTDGNSRSMTVATNKRDAVAALYANDERAAQWHGTAYGVLQATNTYDQHVAVIRKSKGTNGEAPNRFERNMADVLSGNTGKSDARTLALLNQAMAVI